jgi:hypothetical protein
MFWFQGKVIFRFLLLHNFVRQALCKCMYVACSIKQMFVFAFWWKPGIYAFLSIPSCNVCFTLELLSYIISFVTPYNSSINKDLCIQETKKKLPKKVK